MKKNIACALVFCIPLLVSATDIVAPNMEPGHWISTTDTSAILEQTLASVPEESRAMVRKMMEQKMQEANTTEQCVTKEILTNFDQEIKNKLGNHDNCEFNVTESTREKFAATLSCTGSIINITTNVINSKKNESTVISNVTGMAETKIKLLSEWKSSVCPSGL